MMTLVSQKSAELTAESELIATVQETLQQAARDAQVAQKISSIVLGYLLEDSFFCVEVGGTRVKAAQIPVQLTLEKLKTIQTVSFSSTPWFNKSLLTLFKQTNENPCAAQLRWPHSMVSLSIAGPVLENGVYFNPKRDIPKNLKEALEQASGVGAALQNDAVSFAAGCLQYERLKNRNPTYPCLVLTLGTGVGAAFIRDENTIYAVEAAFLDCPYSRLKKLTESQPRAYYNPSISLGRTYFEKVFDKQPFSDEQMTPYLAQYNAMFQALVEDLCEYMSKTFSCTVSSLFVGGGNSRFIQISKDSPLNAVIFSPQKLIEEGISEDSIQLLGCHLNAQNKSMRTPLHPPFEELQKRL